MTVMPRRHFIRSMLLATWTAAVWPSLRAAAAPDACDHGLSGPPSVYLGAWIPAALDDPRISRERDPLGQFDALAGKRISILQRWEHWGLGAGGRIDIKWLRRVVQAGAFPMITWVPWNPTIRKPEFQRGFMMRDVARGKFDGYIADIASEVADWSGPIFIRFAQEMNGTWYPWGKHQNSPDDYIAAWRRVHDIFARGGAGHVTWIWNPSEKNHPETLELWYPGDDVVDWIAVDGYNWDDPNYWKDAQGNTWRSLEAVMTPSFDDIAGFAPRDKPWMIAETSSPERRGESGKKAAWTCDAFLRVLPELFPRIKAVLWFHQPTDEGGKPFPWQVDSSRASAQAFAAAVAPNYYVGDLGDLPSQLGRNKIPPMERLAEAIASR